MRRGRLARAARAAGRLLALAPAAAVLLLFAAGLAGALRASLGVNALSGWGAADLGAYRRLAGDPLFAEAVLFTLWLGVAATVVSAALALVLAAVLRRSSWVGRGLASLPVPVPHLLAALVAVLWLGPGGIADRIWLAPPLDVVRDPLGLGVILVYVWKETPFLALVVLAAWTPVVAAREEAAAVSGAGRAARMRLVVWPAVRAPLAGGCLVVFAFVSGALEVPLVIGPNAPETIAEYALGAAGSGGLDGRAVSNAAFLVAGALALAAAFPLSRLLGRRV